MQKACLDSLTIIGPLARLYGLLLDNDCQFGSIDRLLAARYRIIMVLPLSIRKVARLFRGNVSPVMGGLCLGLGWWCGLIPGFQGIHILVGLLVVILNLPLGPFILFVGIGRATAMVIAPVLYGVGRLIIDRANWLCRLVDSVPILALTDMARPAVVGALIIGLAAGSLLTVGGRHGIISFRRVWLRLEDNSALFRTWRTRWYIQLLEWALLGPSTKDPKTVWSSRPSYIRQTGLIILGCLIALLLLARIIFGNQWIKTKASSSLTSINGATVDIEGLDLALLAGRFRIGGIGFTDPQRPTHNSIQIGQAQAKIDIYSLSVAKVVVDQLKLVDVRLDRARPKAGVVLARDQDTSAKWSLPSVDIDWSDLAGLDRYIQDANKVWGWLERIRPYLASAKAPESKIPQRYLEYFSARHDIPKIRFLAKRIEVEGLQLSPELFGITNLAITNLSDAPALSGPIELTAQSELGARLDLRIDCTGQDPVLEGKFEGLDLARLQTVLSPDNPLRFQAGKVSGDLKGRIVAGILDLQTNLLVTGLRASVGQQGLLGLNTQAAQQLFSYLDRLQIGMWIRGPIGRPRIGFDTKALQQSLKKGLVEAAKNKAIEQVERRIDQQIKDTLPGGTRGLIGPVLDKAGIGGLLGTGKDPNAN